MVEVINARNEFSDGWKLILASFIGMMAGLTALPFYTYGIFTGPLESEFGWSREQTQAGLFFQTIGVLAMLPILGWACDKFGARKIALWSMTLFAITFAAMALNSGSIWQYYATVLPSASWGSGPYLLRGPALLMGLSRPIAVWLWASR